MIVDCCLPCSKRSNPTLEFPLSSTVKTLISVLLGHEVSPFQRGLIVVSALVFAFEQFHFLPLYLLVGNELQEMRDAVKTRPLLVVSTEAVPGRHLRIGGLQHHV